MPWSGSPGSETFSRTDGTRTGTTVWQQAKAAFVKILASDHDTHDQDIATGLNLAFKKDGGNTATADLPMGTFKLTNVGNAAARNQFAAAGQVQDGSFIWCGTAGGTANALTLTPTPAISTLATGSRLFFQAGAAASTGAATIAVSGGDPVAAEINDAALTSSVTIEANKYYLAFYDGTAFQLTRLSEPISTLDTEVDALRSVKRIIISNNGSDADHDIDIAAGAVVDDTQATVITVAALTKQADATFAEGTNQGGFVTGESLPTSGTVHVWAIAKADGTADVCFNNNASSGLSPTLPAGFTLKRRIGSLLTDGSANIVAFLQTGRFFARDSLANLYSGSIGSVAGVLVDAGAPDGLKFEARFTAGIRLSGNACQLIYTDPDSADVAPSATIFSILGQQSGSGANGIGDGEMNCFTNTSGQVRRRGTNTLIDCAATAVGWTDHDIE